MKIGFVIDDTLDKPDGVQQYVLTLGRWLAGQGHEVHFLAGESRRGDIENIHSLSKNVRVSFNQNRLSVPRSADKAAIERLLSDEPPFDILHIQMPYSPFMAGKVIKAAPSQTAVIGTFHIIPFARRERWGGRLLYFIERRGLKRFDHIVSVSAPAAKFARSAMRIRSEVLPNVVDVPLYKTGRKLKKFDDGKINIVFLGRLVERKGAMELLQALAVLHAQKHLENVRVIVCGKGPLEHELKQYVHDYHLAQHVRFEGFIEEAVKPDYLASAHIAVFPSLGGESFGIVLIEAMAAGSETVLGGDNVGYASVLGRDSNQLVNPQDTGAFAKRLHHFIVNSQARRHARTWQQKHVGAYDVAKVGAQLVGIYNQAIAKRRA